MQRKTKQSVNRRLWLKRLVSSAIIASGVWPALSNADDGPNSSLFSGRPRALPISMSKSGPIPAAAPAGSWYEVPLPPPKEVRVHDIVTIRVDIAARSLSDAEFQRRRNSRIDAVLLDWVRLVGLRAIKPAPQSDGDQRVQGTMNIQDRAQGELETTENLKFEIAATVASVLPNGNLVLEAHREIEINQEKWLHSLSGVCRREDIGPGNVLLSKDLANLQIKKNEMGQVRDSYKRGWLTRWFDEFNPF